MTILSSRHIARQPVTPAANPLKVPQVDRVRHALPIGLDEQMALQVREIPYTDQVVALTLARSKLRHFNRFYLDHDKRATLNQWFHYAYARFTENLTESAGAAGDALYSGEGDSGYTLFCDELAVAYKHCLMDGERAKASARQMGQYLYLALFFHAQAMLQRFTYNMRQPNNAWREAHYLYATAEKMGLHRHASSVKLGGALSTVHDQYVQLLLVAGANPYSLGQADTLWVLKFTQRVASATSMVHPDNHDSLTSALGVRLDSDEGPLRLRYKPNGSNPQARLVSTLAICEQLELQRRQWLPDGVKLAGVNPDLLPVDARERVDALFQHLEECWRCQKHRTVTRQSQQVECELVWSLPAIYRWLCNGNSTSSRHFSEQVSQRFNAMRVEESVSGFRFHAPVEYKSFLHPGELLLLANDSDPEQPLSIGILRWIKDSGDGFIVLGASRIEVHVRAAALNPQQETTVGNNERVALLLSRKVQSPQHKFLLCPPDTHCPPGEIDINLPHIKRYTRARVGSVLMSTPFFKVVDTYLMTALN